jgi:hypothetical protein
LRKRHLLFLLERFAPLQLREPLALLLKVRRKGFREDDGTSPKIVQTDWVTQGQNGRGREDQQKYHPSHIAADENRVPKGRPGAGVLLAETSDLRVEGWNQSGRSYVQFVVVHQHPQKSCVFDVLKRPVSVRVDR